MRLRDLWALLKDSWNAWSTEKAPRLGAALAYYTIFSLAPLLVIVIAIAALAFGQEAVQGEDRGRDRRADRHGKCERYPDND